jgi:hypothetical protein
MSNPKCSEELSDQKEKVEKKCRKHQALLKRKLRRED